MKINLLVAPDFSPERFAGWHMLNTVLQKRSNIHIHLITPASAEEQQAHVEAGEVDVIYANPFDSAYLIRDKGFQPAAKPIGVSDEMVIVASAKSGMTTLADLPHPCRIATPPNHDVKLIGLRLLESVDILEDDIDWHMTENYQAAARKLVSSKVDAAFFMAESFAALAKLTRAQLKLLIESDLSDIHHAVLVSSTLAQKDQLIDALLSLHGDNEGKTVLTELGIDHGFASMSQEEGEFMIDLMETLLD